MFAGISGANDEIYMQGGRCNDIYNIDLFISRDIVKLVIVIKVLRSQMVSD